MEEMLSTRVRFGPFELDLKSGELRKGSRTLLLQEQPLRVLQMIVERGGELATRQQIQKKLWPNDTVVDFDHGINTAIKKIRQALGDSADDPKYIQTVARRGYRLLVPVEWVNAGISAQLDQKEIDDQSVKPSPSTLTGKKVSHYRVLEILGGGGMGVVYKAEDLKLGRAVAMKFLPEELGDDPKAKERFEREARAASALDQPNICSIYEFGEYEGQPFIVMQFLAGQNLRDLLADSRNDRGYAFRVDELLDLAIQIVSGLGAAHEKGIIHRDIKPANIFITNRGQAKVLDFGVAKMLDVGESVESADANSSASGETPASWSVHLTRTGVALGTEGYMSPEQIRAESLDARTDLFSFGLVLYEMAAGQRAFTGNTAAELHEAILHQAPVAPRELNPAIPPEVEAIIRRCLEKERERRYQSAEELLGALEGLRDAAPNGSTNQPANDGIGTGAVELAADIGRYLRNEPVTAHHPPNIAYRTGKFFRRNKLGAATAGVGVLIFLVLAASLLWYAHRPLPPPHITEVVQLTSDVRFHRKQVLGTDGARVYLSLEPPGLGSVSVSGGDITVTPIVVPGAKPVYAECQSDVSPDGLSFLACGAVKDGMWQDWVVGISGFPARYLVEAYDIAWSPDGKQVVYTNAHGDIYAMASAGGASRLLLSSNGILPRCPIWSPEGSRIRFVRDARIWEISSNGGNAHEILPEMHDAVRKYCGRWTPDGAFYIFLAAKSRRSGLQIWALDERRSGLRSPNKEPVQLTSGPNPWYLPVISPDARTLYAPNENRQGELVRFNTTTGQFHSYLGGISAEWLDFSPNGNYAAYVSYPDSTLWRVNLDGSGRIQLASLPPEAYARGLHWSPDERHIAFAESVAGKDAIYIVSAEGGPAVRLLPEVKESQSGPTWSPDGKRLAYWVNNPDETSTNEIRIVDLASHLITHLPPAPKNAMWPEWSPNGRYIVCETDWLNAAEFGIEIFDMVTDQWKLFSHLSPPTYLHWSRDSRFVYFLRPQDQDAEPGVYRMSIRDGRIERVVDLKEFLTTGTRKKAWFGLDPGGAPLLLRDVGTFEVYALTLDQH